MNFEFTEEQSMLRDSIARYIQDQYDFDTRCKVVASDEGFSRENWQTFAELGWLSVPFSEESGGFGGDAVDVMVMMEQLGKGLVAEQFLDVVFRSRTVVQQCGLSIPRGVRPCLNLSKMYLQMQ